MAAWSRRPFVGALPKAFQSRLTVAAAGTRLAGLAEGAETVGSADEAGGWLRLRAGPPLPATTLRLTLADGEAGAVIVCRFDESRWDSLDLWIYTAAAAIGFIVAGSWLSGHMPQAMRDHITGAAPLFIALLALVAMTHYGFRRWRQAVRNRLFDHVIVALGVPIE